MRRLVVLGVGAWAGACSSEQIPPFPPPMHHGTLVDAGPQPPAIPGCGTAPLPGTCGSSTTSSAAVVVTLGGTASSGAVVATSRPDGTLIASAVSDTGGCATVASEPDALVTVIAPGNEAAVYTTLAPTSGQLWIEAAPFGVYSPPPSSCPTIPFRVTGNALPEGASYMTLDVGARRPDCFVVDRIEPYAWFAPGCLGTDSELDFQVLAWTYAPNGPVPTYVVSHRAGGRVALVNNEIVFSPQWGASTRPCPLAVDSSVPARTKEYCTYVADTSELADVAPGQVVDRTRVRMLLNDGRETFLSVDGLPQSIPFGPDDLLPMIPTTSAIADLATMRLAWNADVPSADLVHLQAFWVFTTNAFHFVTWHVVLPASATSVQLPALGDARVAPPDGTGPQYERTVFRQYVDNDAAASFDEAVAAGLLFTEPQDEAVRIPIPLTTGPRIRVTTARAD